MIALRVGVGVSVAIAHMIVLRMDNDALRMQLGLFWPIVSFTIWQILIGIVARHQRNRATARTIQTIASGEKTLDLVLSQYEASVAHQDTR